MGDLTERGHPWGDSKTVRAAISKEDNLQRISHKLRKFVGAKQIPSNKV